MLLTIGLREIPSLRILGNPYNLGDLVLAGSSRMQTLSSVDLLRTRISVVLRSILSVGALASLMWGGS